MAPKYAKDMPSDFTNHLTNIAIVGAGGHSGSSIVPALLSTKKHKVTAITRPDSTAEMPSGLHAIHKVDYSDHSALVTALQNQDVLIITLAVMAPAETQKKLIDAAIDAGVKYIIPNEWGINQSNAELAKDTLTGHRILPIREYIESKSSTTHWIGICCGFWYEYSLAGTEARYGFDFKTKTVTLFDNGDVKINTSTFPRVARAVANLLSLKILPADERDRSTCVSHWNDRAVHVNSFFVSQNDMLSSILRVTNGKKSDWTIKHENTRERFARGQRLFAKGQVVGFGILLYSRIFFDDGAEDFRGKLDNTLLGLEEEGEKGLDEATGWVLEMVGRGDTHDLPGSEVE